MREKAENRVSQKYLEWTDYFSERKRREELASMTGYELFFRTVCGLPNLRKEPKHWSDYDETSLDFANIRNTEDFTSAENSSFWGFPDSLKVSPPRGIDVAVFNYKTDKEGVKRQSVNLVVRSHYPGTFRKKVLFNLFFADSSASQKWFESSFDYILFGFNAGETEKFKMFSELDILLAVNALARVYAEKVKST